MNLARALPIVFSLILVSSGSFAANKPKPPGASDTKSPIEITSDALEVFQQENRAVFTGHVVAIQDQMRLKSDTMNVFYKGKQGEAAGAEAASAGGIEKIEVIGNVFLSTPEETAAGAKGLYNVSREELTLSGDVVLTRGKNVLKGEGLVYNMATGKSTLTAAEKANQKPDGTTTRVRALFVPEEKEGAKAKPSAEPKP